MKKSYFFRVFDVKGNLERISDFADMERKVYSSDPMLKLLNGFTVELVAMLVLAMVAFNLCYVTSNTIIILGFMGITIIYSYAIGGMFIYYMIKCSIGKDIKNKIEEHNSKLKNK